MREVDAIVAGGIVPAAMEIGGIPCFAAGIMCGGGYRQMMVSHVDEPGRTLPLEIIQDIRKSVFLEHVLPDYKSGRPAQCHPCIAGLEMIDAGFIKWGETDGPEQPVLPFIHRARVDSL